MYAKIDTTAEQSPFASSTIHSYDINGMLVVLKHHPDVFTPSAFGLRFARCLSFRRGERVADVGTGTGLHAILAAKQGAGEVVATDLSQPAVNLAHYNGHVLNQADQVTALQGGFFAGASGRFDAITANLPQEIVAPAHLDELTSAQMTGVDGQGDGGNRILLDFLDVAPDAMHDGSRLYIIVNTITDYRTTFAKLNRLYRKTVLWQGTAPTKPFVAQNMQFYAPLLRSGVIDIFQDGSGNWQARQFILELRRK
jgi:methylase of polypeptide subunit release factors